MNLLDTDPLKSLLDMSNTGGDMPNIKAPDSDLMDIVLSGQPHENLFRGQMSVPTAPGGGGVSQDALERAGLFSTVNSNTIAGLTGGSFKPHSGHDQARVDAVIDRSMRVGSTSQFYNNGDPMGPSAAEDFLPDYSDTESIQSTNMAHSLQGSDDDEEEGKSDSEDEKEPEIPLPDTPPSSPRPFPNSKFERTDAKNFVFGDDDDDDEERKKKNYKKSLDTDQLKNRKREMKQKRTQKKRQEAVQKKREEAAAADLSRVAKNANWHEDATSKMDAERAGATYMGHARKLVKGSRASLVKGKQDVEEQKASDYRRKVTQADPDFTTKQQAYEQRAARAERPDRSKETAKEDKKRGKRRLKDRNRRKRAAFATVARKRKQPVTTYTRRKNIDARGDII